jgi:hypothetical protein
MMNGRTINIAASEQGIILPHNDFAIEKGRHDAAQRGKAATK